MKCLNCEHDIGSGAVCPACGADAVVLAKTRAVSDNLYNRALQKVKLRDLSGAAECLLKSVEVNKKNINARNLLGLIYCETGELGEALKHWVISTKHQSADNPATGYIDHIQGRTRELDRLNDAIKMYNQALGYVRQKSEDMAIIQLRKAVDISPRFIAAMNLLAFCHLIQKEKEKARAIVERVLAIDCNNAVAVNYLLEMGAPKPRAEAGQKTLAPRQATVTQATGGYTRLLAKDKKSFGQTFHIAEIIFFILGGLCVTALFYTMILPSELEARDSTISRLQEEMAVASQDHDSRKNAYEQEIAILTEEKAGLESRNGQLSESISAHEKIQQAYSIIMTYNSGLIEEAAEAVFSFDTDGLPADLLEQLINVRTESFRETAQDSYSTGAQDYNARRYDEAKINLGKALRFADPQAAFTPDAMYLLGLIAEDAADTAENDADRAKAAEEAVNYYQMIVSSYPDSNRYNRAIEGIRRLSG